MDCKSCICIGLLLVSLPTLVKGSNPYKPGIYKTAEYVIDPSVDGSPLPSTVYFPLTPGNYNVIVFWGGMYGLIPERYYSEFLNDVASHGFIVVGIDRIKVPMNSNGENTDSSRYFHQSHDTFRDQNKDQRRVTNRLNAEGDKFLKQFYWLREHINNRTYSIPDWSHAAFMCHSASCDDILLIVNKTRNIVKGSIFLDPMSFHVVEMAPIMYDLRILTYMAQRSEQFPECCIPGLGWKAIYNVFNRLKVRMEVKDFGHCDLLDSFFWDVCHVSHFCVTTNNTYLDEYRQFTAGVVTGFMQWAVEGDKAMEKYVIDRSLMPLPLLDLAYQDH